MLLDPSVCFQNLPFTPKLTDFSIAKLADGEGAATATEVLLGTPQYIAPELVAGRRDQLGPACDIYALGVVLYELLTGQAPIEGTSQADTLRRVLSDEPVRPRKLAPGVPRDLEAICLTCLEKAPKRRCSSAALLAADLQRFLLHQATVARPIGLHERVYRWARRRPAAAGLIAVSVAASLLIVFGLTLYNQRLGTLNLDLHRSNVNLESALGDTERAKARAEQSEDETQQLLYVADMRLAGRAWKDGDMRALGDLLRRHIPRIGAVDRRGLEWHFLNRIAEIKPRTLAEYPQAVYFLRASPDGKRLATAGKDATVRIHDLITGELQTSIATGQGEINGVDFSHDGSQLVTAGDDGTLRVWNLADHHQLLTIRAHSGHAFQAWFTPDNAAIVSCGNDATIRLWDASSGNSIGSLDGHTVSVESMAFAPGGMRLASAGGDGTARIWDLAERRELLKITCRPPAVVSAVTFSPDGRWFATADFNKLVSLWDATTGSRLGVGEHLDDVHSVVAAPDGRYVASADSSGVIYLWDVQSAIRTIADPQAPSAELTRLRQWRGHEGRVHAMIFSPDSERLITAGVDGIVQSCSIATATESFVVESELGRLGHVQFASSSRLLATDKDHALRAWDLELLTQGRQFAPVPSLGTSFIIHQNGKLIATHSGQSQILLQRLDSGEIVLRLNLEEDLDLRGMRLSPDGSHLAVLSVAPRRAIRLFDTKSGICTRTLDLHDGAVGRLAFAPVARQLAFNLDSDLLLWDLMSDQARRISRIHATGIYHLAYSPDGKRLASAGSDRLIHLWNPATGEKLSTLSGHRDLIDSLAFSPDGRSLVSAGSDGILKFWNVAAGEELFDLYQSDRGLTRLSISPDGRWLACLTQHDSHVLLFDLTGSEPMP